jgi:predicted nucleic acid-binding protein
MKYVIDSSVAFKWVVAEVDSDKACRLREAYRNGIDDLHAVDIFVAEVANALLMAERRGRISDHTVLLADVLTTFPLLQPSITLLPKLSAIVRMANVTVYDALYVALAEQQQCELVTADDKLIRDLGQKLPYILPLRSMP